MAIFKAMPKGKPLSVWMASPGREHRGWMDNHGVHPTRGVTVDFVDPKSTVQWRVHGPKNGQIKAGTAKNLEAGKVAAMAALRELTGAKYE
jgi:hypothetical protein